jgi:hypothetical protein
VNSVSGCSHVVRGETEEELLRNAEEQAKEHGIVQVAPDLLTETETHIQNEWRARAPTSFSARIASHLPVGTPRASFSPRRGA